MLHIVYCIHGTFNSAGMERVLANKANYLANNGYRITIVTTDQQGRPDYFPISTAIARYDLDINYSTGSHSNIVSASIRHLLKTRRHKKRLSRLLKSLKPDVVVSMFCNDVNFLYKIKDGSAKIVEIHFSKNFRQYYNRKGMWKLADKYRDKKENRLVSHYDRFIVLTEQDRQSWGALKNVYTIHNACTFKPERTSPLTRKTVLAVGRFSYQKGFDLLVEAWHTVAFHHPDWKLRIVGDGELKEHLVRQISEAKMEQQIELIKPTKEIEQEYLQSSVFVMSSRYEGLPMVLLEAASCGLPLVAFDCPCGPAEVIVHEQNGLLAQPGQVLELGQAINRLIEDADLRIQFGSQARETAKRFSENNIMEQWVSVFNEIRVAKTDFK